MNPSLRTLGNNNWVRHSYRRGANVAMRDAVAVSVEMLESRVMLSAITWTGGNGNWNVAGNWSSNTVPNSNDDVTISAGGSVVNVTDSEQVISITSTAGTTLNIASTGEINFTNATIAGSFNSAAGATVNVGVSMNVSGTSVVTGTQFGSNGINNSGSLTLNGSAVGGTSTNTGTLIFEGTSGIDNSSSITNAAGGTLMLPDETGVTATGQRGGQAPVLINSGTLILNGGSGTAPISNVVFQDLGGTIDVQAGTLSDRANAYFQDATFNIAAGAAYALDPIAPGNTADTFLFSGTSTGSGSGNLLFNSGAAAPGNPNVQPSASIVNFPAGFALVTGTVFEVNPQDGPIQEITNQGVLDYTGSTGHPDMGMDNKGTIDVIGIGDLADGSSGAFTNDTTGVLNFETDAGVTADGSAAFTNLGLIEKTGGTGTSTIGIGTSNLGFNNNGGTFDVESGTLSLANGTGSFPFTIPDGGVVAAPGAVFNLGAVNLNYNIFLQGNLSVTGGGTFTHDGAYFVGPNGGDGQITTSPATLNFTGDQFTVDGGGFSDNVNLVNDGDVNFASGDLGAILNDGTVTVGAGAVREGNAFINAPGGVLLFSGAQQILALGNNGNIQNAGTVTFSPGAGNTFDMSQTEMSNTGTIIFGAGTTTLPWITNQFVQFPELFPNAFSIPSGSTFVLQSGAIVNVATNPSLTQIAGTVILNSGSSFPALAGLTTITGRLSVLSGNSFTTAGNLTNSGTLSVGGAFAVTGDFTQTAGALDFEVDAAAGAAGAPLFHVAGTTSLAGNLTADYVNGFTTSGGAYTVATFASASSGAFASTSGTAPFFTPSVSPSQIVLNGTAFTGTGGSDPGAPAIGGNGGGGGGGGSTGTTVDLAVTAVTTPANFVAGQSETLGWTVSNDGANATTAGWQDSVFLSTDGVLSSDDILLGRVTESGPVPAAGTYNGTLTVDMPAVAPGSYQIIVSSDSRDVLNDTNRANNVLASAPATDSVIALTPGSVFNGSIAASQQQLFSVTLSAGTDEKLAATLAAALEANIYVGFNTIPTPQSFDQSAADPNQTAANFLLSAAQAGTYYVLVFGRPHVSATEAFTLTPSVLPYGPAAISPTSSADIGQVTMTINGAGFTPTTEVSLVSAIVGASNVPSTVTFVNSNQLYATFALTNAVPGTYSVMTDEGAGGQTASLAGVFTIQPLPTGAAAPSSASFGQLEYFLSAPTFIRAGAGAITLFYENVGGSDIAAPLFEIGSANASFLLTGSTGAFVDHSIEVLGINPTGPAGLLTPGASNSITIQFQQITTGAHVTSNFLAGAINASTTINWAGLKASLKPASVPEDAWSVIYNNFTQRVGTTAGQYQSALDNDATYLGQIGDRTGDVARLNYYQLQQAGDFGEIAHQYALGAFGRGQTDPFNISMATDPSGNATLLDAGSTRAFIINSNGTYTPGPGDNGVLTLSASVYTLTEADGSLIVFNTNGSVNYFQDAHGNRTVATVTAMSVSQPLVGTDSNGNDATATFNFTENLITKLTAANGDITTINYNGQGLATSVTDAVGRTVSYTYDPNTLDLLTTTSPLGTVTYTYYPGATHQVQTITDVSGIVSSFQYDGFGRVMQSSSANGATPLIYSYDAVGNMGETDALGHPVETLRGEDGSVVGVINGAGQHEAFTYDAAAAITTVTNFDGTQSTLSYIPGAGDVTGGNISKATNADGAFETATYGPIPGLPLTRTDADGNTTTITYDSAGDVLTQADPTGATQTNTYNSVGTLATVTTAAARGVTNTYNALNLLISQTFSDGTTSTYSYDAHRNLVTATSAAGIESFTYDSADRLTKVTYPSGLSLTFSYNPQGQLASKTDQSGFTTNYAYDSTGHLHLVTDAANNPLATYTYDAAGNLSRTNLGNGDATTITYNNNGQTTSLINFGPGNTVLSQFDYTYNSAGQVASVTTLAGTTTYQYNAEGELTQALLPGNRTLTFNYDKEGNRTSIVDSGSTTNYTINNLNQYTGAGATTYLYDADGNLTSSTTNSVTTTYGYDVQNRLISITAPGSTTTYQYDALGNRISTTVNGVTTDDLIDPSTGDSLTGEFATDGSVIDHYTYGIGLAGQVDAAGVASYYAFDGSGNTADLTGANGSVLNAYSYLPFGQSLSSNGSAHNPFTFDGQQGVIATANPSLFLTKARLYDATTGRFTARDPLGFAGGTSNLYKYAGNNPVNQSDPSGEIPDLVSAGERAFVELFKYIPFNSAEDLATVSALGFHSAAQADIAAGVGTSGGGLFTLFGENALSQEAAAFYASGLGVQGGMAVKFGSETAYTVVSGGTQVLTYAGSTATFLEVAGSATLALGSGIVNGAPLQLLYYTYEYNKENPNGTPIPEQESLNGSTYQKKLKDPIVQSLIADFTKRNGYPPDQDTITLYIQISSHDTSKAGTQDITSGDPNDILGPSGFGAPGFISGAQLLPYQIDFANEADATAPAQIVTITQTLSPNLDLSTFQLGAIGFGSTTINVPAGLQTFSTVVSLSATLSVDITANLDASTGIVTWTFTSIDPTTGDLTSDPLAGFLPADTSPPNGEGFVDYTIMAKANSPTGTVINAQATVVFDTNAPINTSLLTNTIDLGAPSSTVTALAASQSSPNFALSWTGSDDAGGSGIATFTIYVSTDGGTFAPWLTTTSTTAVFEGTPGHAYGFYSIAVDNVGNSQSTPTAAQATTSVAAADRFITFGGKIKATYTDAQGNLVTVTLAGPGSGTLGFIGAGSSDPVSFIVTGTSAKSIITVHATRGFTTLTDVEITGSLNNFNAKSANLTGSFTITGTLAALTLNNINTGPAAIDIQTAGSTTFKFGILQDLAITDAGTIKLLTAASWTNGPFAADSITASILTKLQIKGAFDANLSLTGGKFSASFGSLTGGNWNTGGSILSLTTGTVSAGFTAHIIGNIGAVTIKGNLNGSFTAQSVKSLRVTGNINASTITLTGTAAVLGKLAGLGSLNVTGAVANSTITAVANIGAVNVGGMTGSELFAGITSGTIGLPTAGDFPTASLILSFTVKGKTPFADSDIAAASIGTVALTNVTTANSGTPFGIATQALKSFALHQPKQKPVTWHVKQSTAIFNTLPGDLRVELL